jgi:hypothetical protein
VVRTPTRATPRQDLIDLNALQHGAALILDHADHGIGHRLHPAHRVVDAEFLLQVADEDVHRRHVRRVAPDEERVETQRHAQARVADAGPGMAIDGAVGAQPDEARDLADKVHQLVHRAAAQSLEPEDVAFLAVLEEPAVAGLVLREQAPHLGDHRVFVLAHAEGGAVAPADFVIGIDGAQIDILVEIAPAFLPTAGGTPAARSRWSGQDRTGARSA